MKIDKDAYKAAKFLSEFNTKKFLDKLKEMLDKWKKDLTNG
jgi:hypothetical protein